MNKTFWFLLVLLHITISGYSQEVKNVFFGSKFGSSIIEVKHNLNDLGLSYRIQDNGYLLSDIDFAGKKWNSCLFYFENSTFLAIHFYDHFSGRGSKEDSEAFYKDIVFALRIKYPISLYYYCDIIGCSYQDLMGNKVVFELTEQSPTDCNLNLSFYSRAFLDSFRKSTDL